MSDTAPTVYFRVDVDVLDDPAICELGETYGPVATATWLALMAMAKQQRDLGCVTTTIRNVGRAIHDRIGGAFEERKAMWQRAIELGLLELVDGELDGEIRVRLTGWERKQALTDAERAKAYRARRREQSEPSGVCVTETVTASRDSVTPSRGSMTSVTQTGRQGEREESATALVVCCADGNPITPARVRKVFDYWMQLFDVAPGNAKLSDARRKRIKWALKEYGGKQLGRCLHGYASDPWRHEQRSRHELTTLLRNEQQVEAGIAKWEQANGVSRPQAVATQTSLTDRALMEAGY